MADPVDWLATSSPNAHEVGSADLSRSRHARERRRVLELAGEYDISNDDDLQATLADELASPDGLLVVDLTRVTFLDAHCTGILLSAASKREIVLVGVRAIVARVLDVLDPTHQLPRCPTGPGPAATKID